MAEALAGCADAVFISGSFLLSLMSDLLHMTGMICFSLVV